MGVAVGMTVNAAQRSALAEGTVMGFDCNDGYMNLALWWSHFEIYAQIVPMSKP